MAQEILIEVCGPGAVTACDLRGEIDLAAENGSDVETYLLIALDDAGYRKSVAGQMLWFPGIGRAGITWGADADWTDADSPEDAVRRYTAGEMTT